MALLEQNGLTLCPGDEMHLVFECAALQVLRDDMPTLFWGVHSMRCFMWHDDMVLMSGFVCDAMSRVRAASSGDELSISSAKLAGRDVIMFYFFLFFIISYAQWDVTSHVFSPSPKRCCVFCS